MRFRTLSALLLVGASSLTLAQEPPEGCDQIMEYFNKGDIDGAKKEAEWCLQALEQLVQQQDGSFFRTEIDGWQRTALSQNNAMGFAVTEATYAKENETISVSLLGGSGGANSLSGIFSTIAQAGIAAGGTNRMRIHQRTAITTDEPGNAQVMITLETGGQLQLTSPNAALARVVAFAQEFPVVELDESRR